MYFCFICRELEAVSTLLRKSKVKNHCGLGIESFMVMDKFIHMFSIQVYKFMYSCTRSVTSEDCGCEPRLDGNYKKKQNRVFHIEFGKPTSLKSSRKQAFSCFRSLVEGAILVTLFQFDLYLVVSGIQIIISKPVLWQFTQRVWEVHSIFS